MRRAAKVDANQPAIVAALRAVGASVQPLHTVGQGCPDLLVGFKGKTVVMELKDGELAPSKRRLTPDQKEWIDGWRGGPVWLVHSVAEALSALEVGE